MDCGLSHIDILSQDIIVDNETNQFQITAVDGPIRVVKGNQIPLNLFRKFVPPENRNDGVANIRNETNAAHVHSSSIAST